MVTTGTSSIPLGFTSGGDTPGGIRSMLESILSLTFTSDGVISSPTSNWIVTTPWPRWDAE